MHDVTQILDRVQQGDPTAAGELLPLVYLELRRIAAHKMAGESPGHTLQPTALVHERVAAVGGQRRSGAVSESRALLRRRGGSHAPHPH